jgi:hypothetical protein
VSDLWNQKVRYRAPLLPFQAIGIPHWRPTTALILQKTTVSYAN